MPATAPVETISAVIRADAAYHISEINKRFGIGEWSLRKMRRNGLPVRRCGRKSWVLGRDLLAYIESQGKVVE